MVNRAILVAILFAPLAVAQEQDQKMMNRIMNVDRTRANAMGAKQFETSAFAASEFRGGEYAGVKSARTKEYRTRSFLGIPNPWFGKKVYQTQAARELTRYVLSDKAFSSRSFEAGAAPDANRAAAQSDRAAETRGFFGRGKSQAALDASRPAGAPLSLDQVREVLNRPR